MSVKVMGWMLILVVSATVSLAAEDYWTNSLGGTFGTGANWSLGSSPANADNARFTNNASYTITWDAVVSNAGAFFDAPGGTVKLSPGANVWQLGNMLGVGTSATAAVTVMLDGVNARIEANNVAVKNANTLVLTNGATIATTNLVLGDESSNSRLVVTGSNSFLNCSGDWTAPNGLGLNNKLTVTNGGKVNIGGVIARFGRGTGSDGQELLVTGAGSTFTNIGGVTSYAGSNITIRVRDGGQVYLGAVTFASSLGLLDVSGSNSVLSVNMAALNVGMSMVISNGAVVLNRGGAGYMANNAASDAVSIMVTDPSSTFMVTNAGFRIGGKGSAAVTVRNGARVTADNSDSTGVPLGFTAGATGRVEVAGANSVFDYTANGTGYGSINVGVASRGYLVVTNSGFFSFSNRDGLVVGNAAGAAGSTVLIGSGGTLESRRQPDASCITVGNFAGNSVSNIGGVFQFSYAAPAITPGAFGNVAIAGGTVSFRSITNADVRCSQSTYSLASDTKVAWSGNNTFRLNNATNVTSGQNYTFASGTPANFAGLELYNGSTYRGGAVTIGSGGSLLVTNGTSTISSNLTFQSGSTYHVRLGSTGSYDRVSVGGTVSLGGTLDLQLAAAPVRGFFYTLIDNTGANQVSGSWPSTVTTSYGGTNYVLTVLSNRGDGNDVVAVLLTRGTVVFVQ